jgi:hypothetical protein
MINLPGLMICRDDGRMIILSGLMICRDDEQSTHFEVSCSKSRLISCIFSIPVTAKYFPLHCSDLS